MNISFDNKSEGNQNIFCQWQVVHLTSDLNPATHHLIANEFLPDMPDNPYKVIVEMEM